MILPKYQWLIEEKASECGFCDKLYLDENAQHSFQVKFEPETLIDENFDSDDIGEAVDLVAGVSDVYIFDASYNPTQDWVGTYTFLEDGIEKAYIIAIIADQISGALNRRITEYGDFSLIEVENGASRNTYIVDAINAYLPAPITAVLNGNNIEISDFPVGTQVVPGDNYPTVSGTTAATWSLNNFFPLNDKVCFFNVSNYNEVGTPTATPSISYNVVVDASAYVSVEVNFINSFGFDVDIDFLVLDNAFGDTGLGMTKTAAQGTNTVTFSFQASASPPIYYIFKFQLSDPAVYSNSIYSSDYGFCFNEITAEQVSFVDTISYVDCDDVTHELGVEDWIWDWDERYNFLITITGTLPSIFQLIITGLDTDVVTSMWYERIDPATCDKGTLYRLRWTDTCQVGDLNYDNENTVFTNELYLTGVLIKTGLDKIEAIGNITTSGKKVSIYEHR